MISYLREVIRGFEKWNLVGYWNEDNLDESICKMGGRDDGCVNYYVVCIVKILGEMWKIEVE